MCTAFCPIGGGTSYMKCGTDLCAPLCIVPQEDGTIDGTMHGIYQKKGGSAGGPSSNEMDR